MSFSKVRLRHDWDESQDEDDDGTAVIIELVIEHD